VIERKRDLTLIVVVGTLLLAGIGFDLATGDVTPTPPERTAAAFYERAQFCPSRILEGAEAQVSIASASPEPIPAVLEPMEGDPLELAAGSTVTRSIESQDPVAVEGYGAPVAAATSHFVDTRIGRSGNVAGTGAGNCATEASQSWYFPSGDSSVATDYRLVIANPFPDEAVAQISFLTSEGEETSAQLSEVAVPAGQVEVASISGAAIPQDLLSVRLHSARGRVVAWKAMWTKPEGGVPGLEFTLGARAPATEWYFPAGEVSERARQTITLMNPNDEESSVSVRLSTSEEPVQSSKLLEIAVAPQSSKRLVIPDRLDSKTGNVGGISAVVSVDNDVPVVAESTTAFDDDDLTGRMTEIGSTVVSDRWLVASPSGSGEPATDALVIQNPTTDEATVDVAIYGSRGDEGAAPTSPERLQGITVAPGLRVSIPLEDIAVSMGSWLEVVATGGEVVAERVTFNRGRSDVSSVMGQPDFGKPIR